jgi:serine palmitoyltransferase
MRGRDVTNRPICGVPGAEIELLERKTDNYNWSFYFTGKTSKAINMGSYNYLGFAENNGPCSKAATQSVKEYGVSTSGI